MDQSSHVNMSFGNQNPGGYHHECFELTIASYSKIWKNLINQEINAATVSVAGEICSVYRRHGRLDELQRFLSSGVLVSNLDQFCTNEKFARALVITRYRQQNFREVTRILTCCRFTFDLDKLVALWDEIHYQMYILEDQSRQITPLQKFRLRKRFPPPKSICPTGERSSNSLPKAAKNILRQWLCNNTHNPYPTIRQKEELARITLLEIHQIRTWFANTRRRLRAKLKKQLGIMHGALKGSKLKILNGNADKEEDDDDMKSAGADAAFYMEPSKIKSMVETILKVESPTSSQEESNTFSAMPYPILNPTLMKPNIAGQVVPEPWNPVRSTNSSVQAMQNLHYSRQFQFQPSSMMTCKNEDGQTASVLVRNNQGMRPSSSLGAPAQDRHMSTVRPLTRPLVPQTASNIEIPGIKAPLMQNYNYSCPRLPTATTHKFYRQENLIQISSDEDTDKQNCQIKHPISSLVSQQQDQYQRLFGVPPPTARTGFVQPNAPQQIHISQQHRFFSPPAPQRVVSSVAQVTSSAFMPCSRVMETQPMTENMSLHQKPGSLFIPPNNSFFPNQLPAFASPRQPHWSPPGSRVYRPLQLSHSIYPSPVAVYRNYNTPSSIIPTSTIYSETQYGYNQVMTPPWTPSPTIPVPPPSQSNTPFQQNPQSTMRKSGYQYGHSYIYNQSIDSLPRIEKPPAARNLFCTPPEEPQPKGSGVLARLKKEPGPVPAKVPDQTEASDVKSPPHSQADTAILDLSHSLDMTASSTPETSPLVTDDSVPTSAETEKSAFCSVYPSDEDNTVSEVDMSCNTGEQMERDTSPLEPDLTTLKPLNLCETFNQASLKQQQEHDEDIPPDVTTLNKTRETGSFGQKPSFQDPRSDESFHDKTMDIPESGCMDGYQDKVSGFQQLPSIGIYPEDPPGFPPQRGVTLDCDDPMNFYGNHREDTKPCLQPLTNVRPSMHDEDEATSSGLTVSPMLLTQLWQTLQNNRNATS